MTRRITVSVPDDVAAHLETVGERQVSSYVTEAVRAAARRERELAAVERLYERCGRRPTDAEQVKIEQITAVTERWRAQHLAAADPAR